MKFVSEKDDNVEKFLVFPVSERGDKLGSWIYGDIHIYMFYSSMKCSPCRGQVYMWMFSVFNWTGEVKIRSFRGLSLCSLKLHHENKTCC